VNDVCVCVFTSARMCVDDLLLSCPNAASQSCGIRCVN